MLDFNSTDYRKQYNRMAKKPRKTYNFVQKL